MEIKPMRYRSLAFAFLIPHAFAAVEARADVLISTAVTENISCSNGVCMPTAPDAVLNVGDLETMLGHGNVTLAASGEPVDIDVDSPLSWAETNILTLDSYHSINIAQPVAISGVGGLTLTTNNGGSGGYLFFGHRGRVAFGSPSAHFTINGTNYTLVNSIRELASAISANPDGDYALARKYDASRDGIYRSSPISDTYNGTFEGLGNSISNITIDGSETYGGAALFAQLSATGVIENLRIENANVRETGLDAIVATLVDYNQGSIRFVSSSGMVAAKEAVAAGGLVGNNFGVLLDSVASVSVRARGYDSGGLAGFNGGTIIGSGAQGSVEGDRYSGGLVGENELEISDCFAYGAVSGVLAGGLAGETTGNVSGSYATGSVRGDHASVVGGFAGIASGTIANSYATGEVYGGSDAYVGGMFGTNYAVVGSSYSTGTLTGGRKRSVGGLVGVDQALAGSLTETYWDTDTSGIPDLSRGAGNIRNDPGIAGFTSVQLQSGLPQGFDPNVWAENHKLNGGLPYLTANPPQR